MKRLYYVCYWFSFFFKQKTAYELRISDWSSDVCSSDLRDGVIWYDGKTMPWRDAELHVLSHGLHYGSCVFEGERSYAGRIFKMEEHHDRLQIGRAHV